MEHVYSPSIVPTKHATSGYVKDKALRRFREGVAAREIRRSEKVIVYEVDAATPGVPPYTVVYDRANETYRCSCLAGFYGVGDCTHIELTPEQI